VVCPPQLHRGLFTTAAVDNIDYILSGNMTCDSLHGTAISLFQHPDCNNTTISVHNIILSKYEFKTSPQLPSWYANVAYPLILHQPPSCNQFAVARSDTIIPRALFMEYKWLEHDIVLTMTENEAVNDSLSWAAFHTIQSP